MPKNITQYTRPKEYDEDEQTQDWQGAETPNHLDERRQLDARNVDPSRSQEILIQDIEDGWRQLTGDPSSKEAGVVPMTFTKIILLPMLDQNLAAGLKYNGRDSAQEETRDRRVLEGQTNEPINHLRTSFARMVQERMELTGLDNAQSPQELAQAIQEHLPAIDAMAEYLNALDHQLENTQAEWADPPEYRPQVLWERSLQGNWDTVMNLAKNGSRPEALASHAAQLLDQATRVFTPSASGEEHLETAQHNKKFEHPKATMLKEAMRDIETALECAQALGKFPEETEDLEEGKESLYQEVRDLALNDMSLELKNQLQGSLSDQEIALYDRALRSLAHADFTLMAVHNQPNEKQQSSTD